MKGERCYRTHGSVYAIWLGLLSVPFLLTLATLAKYGWVHFMNHDGVFRLAASLALPGAALIWLAGYRLLITQDEIIYRSWRSRWRAPRSDIIGFKTPVVGPISKAPMRVAVRLKNGTEENIDVRLFSKAAYDDLLSVLNVAQQGAPR